MRPSNNRQNHARNGREEGVLIAVEGALFLQLH